MFNLHLLSLRKQGPVCVNNTVSLVAGLAHSRSSNRCLVKGKCMLLLSCFIRLGRVK